MTWSICPIKYVSPVSYGGMHDACIKCLQDHTMGMLLSRRSELITTVDVPFHTFNVIFKRSIFVDWISIAWMDALIAVYKKT